MSVRGPALAIRRLRVGLIAFVTLSLILLGAQPANAQGNNRWVYRPGCGYNWVASGGGGIGGSGWADTTKGSHSCTGVMWAGRLHSNGFLYWAAGTSAYPNAWIEVSPLGNLNGYHRGCDGCGITYS